ncbi:MAG: hypothetical protein WCT37_05695 [Patescibacteria group bacterium]
MQPHKLSTRFTVLAVRLHLGAAKNELIKSDPTRRKRFHFISRG